MNDADIDELGPVDYLVVEFPAGRASFSGEMADQLSALAKSGTIRVLDLLFLKKNSDGSVEGFESHEFEDSEVGQLRELEAELAVLLAEEDVEAIGAALEPDSYAAVLVWENVWAAPFAAPAASWSPAAESRSRHWQRQSKPTKQRQPKELEMLGRDRVGRPGLLGGRPVARTAAVAGTAAVVTRGVRRRGDRREDRREDRQDRREDRRSFR